MFAVFPIKKISNRGVVLISTGFQKLFSFEYIHTINKQCYVNIEQILKCKKSIFDV